MNKRAVLIALLSSAALFVAKPSVAESLRDSVDQALALHPSVEAALAGEVIAKEDYKAARSGLFPDVSTSLTAGRIYGDNTTTRGLTVSRGAAYSWLGEGSAAITQPIFDGMETFNRIDATQARRQSAEYNVLDVKENLALQATQAHLAVMQAQATLAKVKSYYEVIDSYLDRIKLMVEEGAADESETAQAKNISLMLKSTLTNYEGQLNAAYAGYRQVVGSMPKSQLLKPAEISSLIKDDVDEAVALAIKNHPLMKQGEKELEATGYDVKAEYGAFYPDLDGELSYLKRDQDDLIGGELVDGRAVLRMSWDFETGGAQLARTRKTRAQYSEVLAQNREQARNIEGDVRRAYAEYETAKKQMELVQKREVVTKDLLTAYETQFEGARVRLLQLMQAENQVFNSQLETITAEYRFLLAQFGVLASMGQLMDTVTSVPDAAIEKFAMIKEESTSSDVSTDKVANSVSEELAGNISKAVK